MIYFKIFLLTLMISAYQAEARKRCKSREVDYSREALISVIPNNAADRKYLLDLARKKIIELWNEVKLIIGNKNLMLVTRSKLKSLMRVFKKRNMKVFVVAYNLQRLIQRNSHLPVLMRNKIGNDPQNFNFGQYHKFENIEPFLKDITSRHTDISKLETFGKSYEKRPLYAVKVSLDKKSDKRIILINCGIHAREWISVSFCLFFINALITDDKENKKKFKTVLDKYDFIIIPVMNPDGYIYSHNKVRLWRKTRSKTPDSDPCMGADANRNFYSPGNCDDDEPCSENVCGHKPFSEPEVAAFKDLLEKTKGKLKAYFDMHSYGQYWLSPWAHLKDRKPKHHDEMIRVAEIGKKALEKRHNTKYTVGMAEEVLYQSKGCGIDYVYEKGFANYSYALELRDKGTCIDGQCGFLLAPNKILPTCEEATDGIIAAILAMK